MSNADHERRLQQLKQLVEASTLIGVDMRLGVDKMIDYADDLTEVIEMLQMKLDKIEAKIEVKTEIEKRTNDEAN